MSECQSVSAVLTHSGFGPSDWPIWTDFVGGNFRQCVHLFVRATEKTKNGSGSENTTKKNYRSGKC